MSCSHTHKGVRAFGSLGKYILCNQNIAFTQELTQQQEEPRFPFVDSSFVLSLMLWLDGESSCIAHVCREKVTVPSNKPYIIFQGAGMSSTIISNSETASSVGTADSATVTIWATNFVAKGMGFEVKKQNKSLQYHHVNLCSFLFKLQHYMICILFTQCWS